jgi:hypothetical protein
VYPRTTGKSRLPAGRRFFSTKIILRNLFECMAARRSRKHVARCRTIFDNDNPSGVGSWNLPVSNAAEEGSLRARIAAK